MNVRTLCLSILYEGEATGYEIRRLCVEGECSYFIEASFGSIYPALAKLEDEGLVTSRTEQQSGKPAKKVYSITEAGRTAFAEELAGPLGDDVFRSPFLLFARFAHILPREPGGSQGQRIPATNHRRSPQARGSVRGAQQHCGRHMGHQLWTCDDGVAERHMRSHIARTDHFGAS